jgi:hypothetical protein
MKVIIDIGGLSTAAKDSLWDAMTRVLQDHIDGIAEDLRCYPEVCEARTHMEAWRQRSKEELQKLRSAGYGWTKALKRGVSEWPEL